MLPIIRVPEILAKRWRNGMWRRYPTRRLIEDLGLVRLTHLDNGNDSINILTQRASSELSWLEIERSRDAIHVDRVVTEPVDVLGLVRTEHFQNLLFDHVPFLF